MKKILLILLSLFICMAAIGCAENSSDNSNTGSNDNSSSSGGDTSNEQDADLMTFGQFSQKFISFDKLIFPATSVDGKQIVVIDTNKDAQFKTIYAFSKTTGLEEYINTLSPEQLEEVKKNTFVTIHEPNSEVKTVYFGNKLLQTDIFTDNDRINLFQEAASSQFFTEYQQECNWTSDLLYSCKFGGINSDDRAFTLFSFTNPNLKYRNFKNIPDTEKYNWFSFDMMVLKNDNFINPSIIYEYMPKGINGEATVSKIAYAFLEDEYPLTTMVGNDNYYKYRLTKDSQGKNVLTIRLTTVLGTDESEQQFASDLIKRVCDSGYYSNCNISSTEPYKLSVSNDDHRLEIYPAPGVYMLFYFNNNIYDGTPYTK